MPVISELSIYYLNVLKKSILFRKYPYRLNKYLVA
jgi:hypothetical protein